LIQQATTAREKYEWQKSRVDAFRNGSKFLFERYNDTFPEQGNTLWAAWMGVTEMADWRAGSSDDLAFSTLLGSRAAEKTRSFDTAIRLMK
jgi:hypothetical protein